MSTSARIQHSAWRCLAGQRHDETHAAQSCPSRRRPSRSRMPASQFTWPRRTSRSTSPRKSTTIRPAARSSGSRRLPIPITRTWDRPIRTPSPAPPSAPSGAIPKALGVLRNLQQVTGWRAGQAGRAGGDDLPARFFFCPAIPPFLPIPPMDLANKVALITGAKRSAQTSRVSWQGAARMSSSRTRARKRKPTRSSAISKRSDGAVSRFRPTSLTLRSATGRHANRRRVGRLDVLVAMASVYEATPVR